MFHIFWHGEFNIFPFRIYLNIFIIFYGQQVSHPGKYSIYEVPLLQYMIFYYHWEPHMYTHCKLIICCPLLSLSPLRSHMHSLIPFQFLAHSPTESCFLKLSVAPQQELVAYQCCSLHADWLEYFLEFGRTRDSVISEV